MENNYYTKAFFDSKVRFTGTSSRPTFRIDTDSNEFNAYRVEKIAISNTIYNINATNSALTIVEYGVPPAFTVFSISLAEGNYDQSSFCTALAAALNAGTINGYVYSCTVSSITGKLTISSSLITKQFSILEQGALYSFDLSVTTEAQSRSTLGFLDLQPYTTLYLNSTISSSQNYPGGFIGDVNTSYTIAAIYLNEDVGFWHIEENNLPEFIEANGRFNVPIEFWIADASGNQIDLNGGSFAVTMGFKMDRYL